MTAETPKASRVLHTVDGLSKTDVTHIFLIVTFSVYYFPSGLADTHSKFLRSSASQILYKKKIWRK